MVLKSLEQMSHIGHIMDDDLIKVINKKSFKLIGMKTLIYFLATLLILSCNETSKQNSKISDSNSLADSINSQTVKVSFLNKYPLLTLLRKTPVEIGCMLETEFNFKDSVFNCNHKNYINKGDPCKKIDEYYEGIKIPDDLIKKIDPSFKEINLDFEHGNLREITITFQDSILKNKIREMFNLPIENMKFPNNVISIDYGDDIYSKEKPIDTNYTKWLIITGFDHIGAAEAGCK